MTALKKYQLRKTGDSGDLIMIIDISHSEALASFIVLTDGEWRHRHLAGISFDIMTSSWDDIMKRTTAVRVVS